MQNITNLLFPFALLLKLSRSAKLHVKFSHTFQEPSARSLALQLFPPTITPAAAHDFNRHFHDDHQINAVAVLCRWIL
jgi:hypothetical protein